MSTLARSAPWLVATAALALSLVCFIQARTARRELATWHATVGTTAEEARAKAAAIEAEATKEAAAVRDQANRAKAQAERALADAEAEASAKSTKARELLASVEAEYAAVRGVAADVRAKELHRLFPHLRKLEGETITPTDADGKPHPFVERIELGKAVVYNNTTARKVQPTVSVSVYNAAGVRIASMYDSWAWQSIGPGERRVEEAGLIRETTIVGDPGSAAYYSIEIEDREENKSR